MLLLAFTYPFDFERRAFLTRHCRASTLCVSSSILVWLYCSDWHRSGASNSLYIVGQMHPTLILSGLDQWNAWSLCDCVLNVKVQCFCYGLMNQRECTISTGMFTEKKERLIEKYEASFSYTGWFRLPFLMQTAHLSKLGTDAGNTITCDLPRLGLCL